MRYPTGMPYQGPIANYDDGMDTAALVRRLAYQKAQPLLGPREQRSSAFYGRLYDQLANSHVALVKVYDCENSARCFASTLRKEVPADSLFEVAVKRTDDREWNVLVYNRVTMQMALPEWMRVAEARPDWLPTKEVARLLGVGPGYARRLILKYDLPHFTRGGRNEMYMHRNDLVMLANRPGQWKRKRVTL